jgi:hypothetical protein
MDVCLLCLYVLLSCVGKGLCNGLITRLGVLSCVLLHVWSQKPRKGPYVLVGTQRKMDYDKSQEATAATDMPTRQISRYTFFHHAKRMNYCQQTTHFRFVCHAYADVMSTLDTQARSWETLVCFKTWTDWGSNSFMVIHLSITANSVAADKSGRTSCNSVCI